MGIGQCFVHTSLVNCMNLFHNVACVACFTIEHTVLVNTRCAFSNIYMLLDNFPVYGMLVR